MTPEVSTISPAINRRQEPRLPAQGEVRYLPTRAAKNWRFLSGRLVDCSAHGIGLICSEPMPLGDDFIVKLPLGKTRLAVYRVQDLRDWHGAYRIGGEFIGLLVDPQDVDYEAIVQSLSGGRRSEGDP